MSVLIVTATVTPSADVPLLTVRDPARRLQEYLAAWPHHLAVADAVGADVVLTENSGAGLAPFATAAESHGFSGRLELMPVAAAPGHKGRGYGELRLLQSAFSDARLLAGPASEELVWKVTGRYRVLNLERLVRTAPRADIYCNLRRFRGGRWIDQYAFATTRSGFERFVRPAIAALERNDGSTSSELALFDAIYPHRSEERVVPRFKLEPRLSGVAAWNERSYDSRRERSRYLATVVLRRALPMIWI